MILLLALWLHPAAAAEDWPQFRGPRGDGTSKASGLPATWSETRNVRWKTPIAGRGWSSPVVLGDRVWLTTAVELAMPAEVLLLRLRDHPDAGEVNLAGDVSLRLICLDRPSGRQVYDVEVFHVDRPEPVHRLNSYATPTPVVEPGRVYCDFGSMGTACLDGLTGRILWKAKLATDHFLGPVSSPVLCKDRLLLVRDGAGAPYVAALDKRTGRTAWKTGRPPMTAEDKYRVKAYSTPLVVEAGAQAQAIVPGAQWVAAYDPANGREIWRVRHGKGYSLVPRPVYAQGMVYVCTGYEAPELWAIRIDGQGDVTTTHVAWKARRQIPGVASPLATGREVYCVSDTGIASCFDAIGGQLIWRERIGREYRASPISADGRLYLFGWDGRTTILAAGRQFRRLAENPLDGSLAATPAVAGRAIYVRTATHLYCLEQKP
jgi:hypothetical protein